MNPVLPLWLLLPAVAILAAFGAFCAWKSAAACTLQQRLVLSTFRGLALLSLLLPTLNFGKWVTRQEMEESEAVILVDSSSSMQQTDDSTSSRYQQAIRMVFDALGSAQLGDIDTKVYAFDTTAELLAEKDADALALDGSTDIPASVISVLDRYPPGGKKLSSIVLISDGRQIEGSSLERMVGKARAQGSPLHVLPVGESKLKDVAIAVNHRLFTAFKEQQLKIPYRLSGEATGKVEVSVRLSDAAGNEVERMSVRLDSGESVQQSFEVQTDQAGRFEYQLSVAGIEDESDLSNNQASFAVTVLDDKVKVLLVEGSPYWETKFIAQLLQRQGNYELDLMARLADDRFFSSGQAGASDLSEEALSVFPESAAAIEEYDLILFGKNVESFLDENKAALLAAWVEDYGGGLVMTRGNPVPASSTLLANLKPITWESAWQEPYRWRPTTAGENVQLFGSVLPGRDDPVWASLPLLNEAGLRGTSKPFTQVLVEGVSDIDGRSRRFPVVVSRRTGEGLVVAVNAGDLWQWDFLPDSEASSDIYREFWLQLLNWAVTYSEFLPGQNFSLAVTPSKIEAGDPFRLRVRCREGAVEDDYQPLVRLKQDGALVEQFTISDNPAERNTWESVHSIDAAGNYQLELQGSGEELLTVLLEVAAPPTEDSKLSADQEYLFKIAEETSGEVLADADGIISVLSGSAEQSLLSEADARWEQSWAIWQYFLLMLSLFGLEWFFRRRFGLV